VCVAPDGPAPRDLRGGARRRQARPVRRWRWGSRPRNPSPWYARRAPASGLAVVDHHLRFEPHPQDAPADRRGLCGRAAARARHHAASPLDRSPRPHSWWAREPGAAAVSSGSADRTPSTGSVGLRRSRAVTGELHTFVRERHPGGRAAPKQADADEFAAIHLRVGRGRAGDDSAVGGRAPRPGVAARSLRNRGMLRFDSEGRLWGSRCESGVGAGDPPLEELSESEDLGREARRAVPDSPSAACLRALAKALVDAVRSGAPTVPEAARFDDGWPSKRSWTRSAPPPRPAAGWRRATRLTPLELRRRVPGRSPPPLAEPGRLRTLECEYGMWWRC